MFSLTSAKQAAATVKQYARALTGDNVVLGDVVRVNASAGGGHAVVLHIDGSKMHVTGFYQDGKRWTDFVQMSDCRRATPYQIDKLVKVASISGYEMELISRELAANIEEAACLEMAAAAV